MQPGNVIILFTSQAAYQAISGAGVAWKGRTYHFQAPRARSRANGLGSLTYLLLSGLMTLWLALVVRLVLLVSAYAFHWRSLPMAGSITLGSHEAGG